MKLSFVPAKRVIDTGRMPGGGGVVSAESVFGGPASAERKAVLKDSSLPLDERLALLATVRPKKKAA